MTGLIWFVHVVHYPLFDRVEPGSFRRYHSDHTRLTGLVVGLPMVVELLSAGYLALSPPEGVRPGLAWLGFACVVLVWGTTAGFSIPAHNRLASGFQVEDHRLLVRTNSLRAVGWTVHSAVMLVMTARLIR